MKNRKPIFFVASRGHHADIGGTAPGSMTPRATHIVDEGVILNNIKLVSEYRFLYEEIFQILTEKQISMSQSRTKYSRFESQIAANEKGVLEINSMVSQFSFKAVEAL